MKILIVEDNENYVTYLVQLLKELINPDEFNYYMINSLSHAKTFLDENHIDLLLLDLNLDGKDGLTLLANNNSNNFKTIIVSGHTERAIEVFKFGVVDFVAKPVTKERLGQAIVRYNSANNKPQKHIEFFNIKKLNKLEIISISEVMYIKGAGTYNEIHLENGNVELYDKSLDYLETVLSSQFKRTHKSYIVDFKRVKDIQVLGAGKYQLTLTSGEKLPVSRSRYKKLIDTMS